MSPLFYPASTFSSVAKSVVRVNMHAPIEACQAPTPYR